MLYKPHKYWVFKVFYKVVMPSLLFPSALFMCVIYLCKREYVEVSKI
nr:MAG TPA: hypothetical protein [Caudoviricetes sp.]